MAEKEKNKINNKAILEIIRTANALTKAGDKFFSQFNVTSAQYNALVVLNVSEEKINQRELGTKLVVSRSDITGIVDRLEKSGYVKRVPHPKDRRIKLLSITEKGKKLINKVEDKYFKRLEEIVSNLTLKDKKKLIEINGKINKGLGNGK
jgi:DNA-binding MarR family transcriptional regulator